MNQITKRYRWQRDNFSEEEDIPLAELVGRLKVRYQRSEGVQETVVPYATSDDEMSVVSDEAILVDRRKKWNMRMIRVK